MSSGHEAASLYRGCRGNAGNKIVHLTSINTTPWHRLVLGCQHEQMSTVEENAGSPKYSLSWTLKNLVGKAGRIYCTRKATSKIQNAIREAPDGGNRNRYEDKLPTSLES